MFALVVFTQNALQYTLQGSQTPVLESRCPATFRCASVAPEQNNQVIRSFRLWRTDAHQEERSARCSHIHSNHTRVHFNRTQTEPSDWSKELQVHPRHPSLRNCPAFFSSTPSGDVSLKHKHGRLVLEVPLPSRNEKCLFFLQPMLMTVGDLIADLQREDSGAAASILSADGQRVANTTLLDTLLETDFQLVVNNQVFTVSAPEKVITSREHARDMEDMKHVVHLLHAALHLPEHHLLQERHLLERMDNIKQELSPLEQTKAALSRTAEFHTSRTLWTGMALLSVQGGALGWLTWWVYSWDVMEPVTYFITYATSMGAFAYYILTKQDYLYPDAQDRQFLRYFYKGAKKKQFNVEKYNKLKDELEQVEEDLRRLKYPNQLQLPLEQIRAKP